MDDEKHVHGLTVLETDSEGPVNAKVIYSNELHLQ